MAITLCEVLRVRSPCPRFCLSGAIALCVGSLRAIAESKETLRTIGGFIDASKRNFADLSQQVSHY